MYLFLVNSGEGVGVSVSSFLEDITVDAVEYCAYSQLRRHVFHKNKSFTAGEFEVLTHNGRTGIGYKIPVANGAMDDAM